MNRSFSSEVAGLASVLPRSPLAIVCRECGNQRFFVRREIQEYFVHLEPTGLVVWRGRLQDPPPEVSVEAAVLAHMRAGAGQVELNRELQTLECARCSSTDFDVLVDTLGDCFYARCEGCMRCEGMFNEEGVQELCRECVTLRAGLAEDRSLFYLTLDMDLYCDACPVAALREEYGIDPDTIKRSCSGKLQAY